MNRPSKALPVLFLLVCCVFPARQTVADPASDVVGQWRWIRSTDFLTGEVETPESAGEERVTVFRSSGECTFLVNGTPTRTSTWSIQPPPMNCGAWGFEIDSFLWCGGVTEDGSLLWLDGSLVVDGPLEEYEWLGPIATGRRSWSALKESFDP